MNKNTLSEWLVLKKFLVKKCCASEIQMHFTSNYPEIVFSRFYRSQDAVSIHFFEVIFKENVASGYI